MTAFIDQTDDDSSEKKKWKQKNKIVLRIVKVILVSTIRLT